ncbi:hypothetical protein [Brevibacillus sp. DP1.3A]|uniref:hypothetical protein n=1 Tax=Brevibacillus sp. DP1.3A TaxID=2738867 RepID=UPI00156B7DD7|nr:hypothetical protein [Brevibacillus sp. DP1.3A]MED1919591.1 hypothetical protein [Bacillus thuringiensis]UED77786.1 hypothetical protein HP399_015440 [Brevibacillus sp. DP1.3A]
MSSQERRLERIEKKKEKISKMEARLGVISEPLREQQMKTIDLIKSSIEIIENDIRNTEYRWYSKN